MSEGLGFTYRATKDGKVLIARDGRQIVILAGAEAARFLAKTASLDDAGVQQELARVTGNYRRGNERLAKQHPRNR